MSDLRKNFVFLIIFLCFLFLPIQKDKSIFAADFNSDYQVTYTIDESGSAQVNQEITLTNNTYDRYVADYTLMETSEEIDHINAYFNQQELVTLTENQAGGHTIKVLLGEKTAGYGKQTTWNLNYNIPNFSVKKGRVWDIYLPRIQNSTEITNYELTLIVPESFGNLQYQLPPATSTDRQDQQQFFYFLGEQGENVRNNGLFITFGESQFFDFELSYYLANPLKVKATTEIPLLPIIPGYQEIYLSQLHPQPEEIYTDTDGNIIATYLLNAKSHKTVIFRGQIEIHYPLQITDTADLETLKKNYTQSNNFWMTENPLIEQIIQEITSPAQNDTDRARTAYEYTLNKLNYNTQRFNSDVQRLGAISALNQPNNAVCMEYTDVLITLLRKMNIPARELDGYAYNYTPPENNQEKDILHSWVQFFNTEESRWQFVDPTWEDTSQRDYFYSFDTDHIVFTIKGLDPEKPYPAGCYKPDTKDNEFQAIDINYADQRDENSIPFILWQENWERENASENFLDHIFYQIYLIYLQIKEKLVF